MSPELVPFLIEIRTTDGEVLPHVAWASDVAHLLECREAREVWSAFDDAVSVAIVKLSPDAVRAAVATLRTSVAPHIV
jgi:hypothetical protein